jgi:hypothetical protein
MGVALLAAGVANSQRTAGFTIARNRRFRSGGNGYAK